MSGAVLMDNDAIEEITVAAGGSAHVEVYHVVCENCGSTTVHDVDADAMRIVCDSCSSVLTLPAKLEVTCPACSTTREYSHTLAGHSSSCGACGRTLTMPAIVGRVKRTSTIHRPHYRHERQRGGRRTRTLAFSDSAERSLILIAAGFATLLFLMLIGLR